MKISHEIPKQLFMVHDLINDYPYILAHLLDESSSHYDKVYADFYRKKILESTFSILDNSAYELGKSIDIDILYRLGEDYVPSHIVLPDSYGNYLETRSLVEQYLKKYNGKSIPKFFAVVQGNTFKEYVECINYYQSIESIDIIGFNARKIEGMSRHQLLDSLFEATSINKKVHLLGCFNPGEFSLYDDYLDSEIHSVYKFTNYSWMAW
jgi:hypothetical protein